MTPAQRAARRAVSRQHTAWCTCGHRFAGRPAQIAYAAEVHWRICPAPWRLHLEPPVLIDDTTTLGAVA